MTPCAGSLWERLDELVFGFAAAELVDVKAEPTIMDLVDQLDRLRGHIFASGDGNKVVRGNRSCLEAPGLPSEMRLAALGCYKIYLKNFLPRRHWNVPANIPTSTYLKCLQRRKRQKQWLPKRRM